MYVGGAGGIGQPLCLLMAMHPRVWELSVYDLTIAMVPAEGIGADELEVRIPLRPGPGGSLHIVLDSPLRLRVKVSASMSGAPLSAGRGVVPTRWELHWLRVEVPARSSSQTVLLRLEGLRHLAVLDIF